MRIGLLIDRFGDGKGGAERYLVELASWLARRGDEAVLVCGDRPASFPGAVVSVETGALPRGLRELRFAGRALRAASRAGCEVRLAVRHVPGAEIFQPHGGAILEAWKARGESKRGWRKAVWTLGRGFDGKFAVLRALEKESVRRARSVLTVSEFSAAAFRKIYPAQAAKIHAVFLGTDLERFSSRGETVDFRKRFGLPASAGIALFAAYDFELKGLRMAIETVARLRQEKREIALVVLGRDRRESRWRRLVAAMGIENAIHFAGEAEALAPWYRGASFLLHPTFFDPCARVALEALACGLPVVTTRRNGACEAASQGIEVVEDPRDVASFALACRRVLGVSRPDNLGGFLAPERSRDSHFSQLREEMEKTLFSLKASGK